MSRASATSLQERVGSFVITSYSIHYTKLYDYPLTEFEVLDEWQPVKDDPAREVVQARWRDPGKAKAEVRDLVLMRRLGRNNFV